MHSAIRIRPGVLALTFSAAIFAPLAGVAQSLTIPMAQSPVESQTTLHYGPARPAGLAQPFYSSSLATGLPAELPAMEGRAASLNTSARSAAYFGGGFQAEGATQQRTVHAFSDVAAQVKFGSAGIGFDIATPLAKRLNLRVGASFFSYQTSLVTDGLHIDGGLSFANASFMVDYFPFNNSFRISPGMTFYNDTHLIANLSVPGGQSFDLGDNTATSDPNDPVHGQANVKLGGMISPRLTFGWGNMIPRKGNQRWSVPVEFGIQYQDRPALRLSASGQSCSSVTEPDGTVDYGCGPVDQADLQKEQRQLQEDIAVLRFFPIFSLGLSYRFGVGGR